MNPARSQQQTPMQMAMNTIGRGDVMIRFRKDGEAPFIGKWLGLEGGWLICAGTDRRVRIFNGTEVLEIQQTSILPAMDMPAALEMAGSA